MSKEKATKKTKSNPIERELKKQLIAALSENDTLQERINTQAEIIEVMSQDENEDDNREVSIEVLRQLKSAREKRAEQLAPFYIGMIAKILNRELSCYHLGSINFSVKEILVEKADQTCLAEIAEHLKGNQDPEIQEIGEQLANY